MTDSPAAPSSAADRLRQLLARPEILVLPGAGAPIDLVLAEQAGFEAGYVSGYATAALRHGLPDIGLVAMAELAEMVGAVRRVCGLPLVVDCDTGYGDIANVRHAVAVLEGLGVAGIQLEDQVWPKRCGHMDGKFVEPMEIALRKVRAAVAARRNPDTVLIARSDARGPHGLGAALDRCKAFLDAGADVAFVDGPTSIEELETICREIDAPLLANMSETGLTPILSAAELQQMGFAIALFPSTTARICVRQVTAFLAELRRTGDSRPWLDRMASLADTNRALGIEDVRGFEERITSGEATG